MKKRVGLLVCVFLIHLSVYILPAAAQPWTITVTTNVDENDNPWTDCPPPGNNDCSLREAILVANFNGAPGDTIVFDASLDGTTITLNLGSLWIGNETNTTIDAWALNTGITINANGEQYPIVLDTSGITIQGPITITNAGAGGVAVVINTSAAAATLDGITVTGNPNVGIGVDSPANLTTITNVTVTNNGGAGISLYGSASTTQISNCTVSNNGGTGIYVAPQNVTIQNCTINNNGNGGISIAASSGLVQIQNSALDGNTGGPAIFSLAPDVSMSFLTITNNPVGGITLQGSNVGGSSIQFSTISNNGLGIFIGNATGSVDISLNTIYNNGGAGVSVRDSSNINIQSNTITSNGQDGISSGVIVVGASSDITIYSNSITGNGGNGVTILEDFATDTAPQGVRIQLNTISNNGFLAGNGVGIQIAGAVTGVDSSLCVGVGAGGSVSISANAIYQNAAQGILIERTPAGSNGPRNVCIGIDPVNGGPQNFIYDNVQEGVLLRDPGTSNNIVANSYIGTPDGATPAPNGNAGVSIYGGATNNIVEGNQIRYNQYQDVLISGVGTTGNIVRNNTIQGGTDVVPRQGYDNAGVVINNGASANIIGPNNFIQYHYYDGVQVVGPGTDNNQIIQNIITNNGLGIAVLNDYPGTDAQLGPPTPGPANTLIQLNQIFDNNDEGIFIRRDNGGTVIGENAITNNNGEGILLIGSSPSIQNNTIIQNAANGILALVYFGADDSPSTANDDVLSQPSINGNNTFSSNGGFGVLAIDTPLGDLSAINANNNWRSSTLARIQQDWYGYVRVVDAFNNPVTGLTVQIDQNAPCTGSYTSAVSDPNGNYGPAGFTINSERTYFQITEEFVDNNGTLFVCTPQTVHDVPATISGIYAYDGDYPNPPTEQGGAIESPPGSGVDRYQFALLQQPLATADLSISKTDSPDPVLVGDNLTYTITVTNAGPSPATNVVVTDTLPAGVTFVSAVPSQGSCNPPVGNVVTCNLGTLNAGASATITIVVTPTVPGTIINTVTVSSDTADPNPNNNTGQQDTTVEGPVGGDPPIWGTLMVFPTPEQHFGRGPKLDLNRNKSLNDCVLRVRDLQTSLITNTGVFVSCAPRDLDLYEHTVAFVSPEGKLGLYNIATGALTSTGFTASHPAIYGDLVVFEHVDQIALWDGSSVRVLGIGRDPVIWENFIAFVGPANTIQIYDLTRHELRDTGLEGAQPAIYDGIVAFVVPDHAQKRSVIRLYEIATGRVEETEAVGSWPAIFGRYVVFQTDEASLNTDLNGDGDRTDTVIRYYDRELRQVFNTAHVGSEPDIYDGLIAFWVYESSYGQDLNGDGDRLDPIVQTYRIPTEGVSVPLRVTRIALERMDRSSIRFIVQGEGIEAVRVEIYDLQGCVLYRSEFVPGQRVIWYGRAQDGSLLANGVYLAVLTIKGSDRVERSAVQKVVILR